MFRNCGITKILVAVMVLTGSSANAQRYLADYDSTMFIRDTLRPFLKRFENFQITGYMQPQFQVAQEKGTQTFEGGNFSQHSNNRFMIRRARIKIDYLLPAKDKNFPKALFTFQFEATERDVNVRDMFIRVFEPRSSNFSLTMGLVARPFGYEVNLSSSYRESPERGRMSQTLMTSERDLGAMVTYESQKPTRKNPLFKFDFGVFNGQGKSGPAEFDSYKDIISRLTLKPFPISKKSTLAAGLSLMRGGWMQSTQYKYEMNEQNGKKYFQVDSSQSNIGDKAPRNYYGADMQYVITNSWGKTEFRGEYWKGVQPGTISTTINPGVLPTSPTFIRDFDGAFFYFIQNIVNEKWEFVAKYDWYDPNTDIEGLAIGTPGTNTGVADIKYYTLGLGLTRYFTGNLKFLAYYSMVTNEKTQVTGYESDIRDNVFTFRIQLRF